VRRRVPAADDALCRRCLELTAGNPLGVRELAAAIEASDATIDLDDAAARAARSLGRSVLRRLAALPADARAMAEAVAVFEGGVPLHRAGALAGLDPAAALAAADALSHADILTADDPAEFTHPLLRAAVYESLSRRARAETHRRAADVLLAAGAPSEQVATHLVEAPAAGDPLVVSTLRSAAREAIAHGVTASATTYLERALREPPADAERAAVLAELGSAEAPVMPRRGIEHLEAAIALTAEPARRAELALELGRAMHDAGRLEDACAAFARGAAELGDEGGDLAVDLEAWYLTSAWLLPDRAQEAHRRIEAIQERVGPGATPAERALLSKALAMSVYEGRPHGPLRELARALYADGRLVDEGGIGSQAAGHVAGMLSYCDDYELAAEALARCEQYSRRTGWITWLAASRQLLARQQLWTGPIPDAITNSTSALEIFASGMQLYLPASAYCLARAHLERDDPDAAEAVLDEVDRTAAPIGIFAAWQHEARGRIAAHRGEHERALAAFLACGEWVHSVLIENPAMFHWRSEAGLAALRLGDRERAAELIAGEVEAAERFGAPRGLGVARRAAALLERGDAAEAGLRSAADLLAGCGAQVELAHTLVALGGAIRRNGRPAEAREPLREALRLAAATGAVAAGRRAREELVRAGGRAPARDGAAGDLTPSERRVAELAAAGRTNRQIADELFVTVKAVEWHLGNAYRKLDIRGRGELAQALS
jgi:DNA-binding CsgD family transcriptional regulator